MDLCYWRNNSMKEIFKVLFPIVIIGIMVSLSLLCEYEIINILFPIIIIGIAISLYYLC